MSGRAVFEYRLKYVAFRTTINQFKPQTFFRHDFAQIALQPKLGYWPVLIFNLFNLSIQAFLPMSKSGPDILFI